MTVTGDNTAPASIAQGGTDDLLRFRLQVTAGAQDNAATWTALAVTVTGTLSVTDLDNVIVYRDANADGVWQATDNVIGYAASPAASPVSVTLSVPQTITGALSPYYFVVYKLKNTASAGAAVGAQIASAASVTLASPDTVSSANLPLFSSAAPVTDAPDQLTLTGTDVAPATIVRGYDDAFLRLVPSVDQDSVVWTGLVVTKTGTAPVTDLDNVIVYRDANADNVWQATDTVVGYASNPAASPVTVTFSSPQTITASAQPSYFVVLSPRSTAAAGNTVGASIAADADILIQGTTDTRLRAGTTASGNATITLPADTVTVTGDNTAPASIAQGGTDDLLRFRLQVTAGAQDNAATWTALAVTVTGTLSVTDLDNVIVYRDANADGVWQATDNVIGYAASPAASPVSVTLSVPQTITGALSPYYFVVYKLKNTASAGAAVGAQIASAASVTLASPDTVSSANLPLFSSAAPVTDAPDQLTLTGTDVAPATIVRGYDDAFLRLVPSVDQDSVVWTGLVVTKTGTAPVTDLDNVIVYRDANADNVWQATDTVVGYASNPAASPVTVTFSSPQTITASAQPSYFVVLSPRSTAAAGNTVGASIAADADILIQGTTDTRLRAGTTASGNATIQAADSTPPAAIADFAARDGENGQSTLTWTNPSDADLAEVRVLRRQDAWPTGPGDAAATVVYDNTSPVPSSAVTYVDTGLTNSTTYYYAVFPRDAAGNWNNTVDNTAPGVNANRAIPGPYLATPPVADTWVNEASATTNYGTATTMSVQTRSGQNRRVLVQFDVSAIPSGTTVSNATLYLYMSTAPVQSRTYAAHRITSTWTETGVNWNNQPTFNSTATATTATGTVGGVWLSWNVTSDVQAWVNGTAANYGILVKDNAENSGTKYTGTFATKEGGSNVSYLSISYGAANLFAPPRQTGDNTAIACNTCHQFAPDDATPGYKDNNQYYYAQPGSHAKHGVSLIGGTDPTAANASDTCTVCHLAGTASFGYDHADGAVDLRSGSIGTRAAGPAFSDDGTYDNASRTCSNVYCHAGRPTPQAAGKSWGFGSSACGACHAVTPPYGKHAVHNSGNTSTTPTNGSTAANYDFSCYYCHPSGSAHVNYPVTAGVQAAEVAFSGTLGGQTLSGTYTAGGAAAGWDNVTNQGLPWTNGSCASVYCHSNGQGGAPLVTPTWNHVGFPTATCTGCHDTGGSASLLSTRHRKHTDNTAGTGYNFTCDECHALTVANDSRTTLHATTGRPNHVDGNLTVQFSTTLRTTSVAIGGTYTQGVDNCANTYCHSDGTSLKNSGTIQPNSVTWGTSGPLGCGACHGNPPSYATSGTRRNSHGAHASFGCQTCHSPTTTTGTTITNAANHVNGAYDVSGTGFAYAFDNVNGSTCTFTAGCHSGTVRWGTTLTGGCFACHTGTEVANKPLEAADGIANPVDNAQYASTGHGNSTTYSWDNIAGANFQYSFTGSPNNGCYECHSSAASHIPKSSADPYRLGAWATNVDGLCNDCHGPSAANPKKASNALNLSILGHNKANTGSTRTWPGNYDYKCVDCHDPHGDANYYMVRSAVNNPTSSTDTSAGSNAYGTPKDNALTAITFTSLAGYAANSYAMPGGGSYGICEVCHNQTNTYSRTQDNVGTHASRTGRCTACHDHKQGFKGAGTCTMCHSSAMGPRRAITPEFGLASHHNAAVNASTVSNITCVQCHAEGDASGNMTALHNNGASSPYPIDLNVYGTYPTVASTVQFTDLASATLAQRQAVNAHCLSCHNETNKAATPFSGNGGDTNTPVAKAWDSNSVASKYSNTGTTPFGKFNSTVYNVLPWDNVPKAYSPHGNVAANRGGYATAAGWSDRGGAGGIPMTGTRTGVSNVPCLDCHNSHGSSVTNTWWKGTATTWVTGGLIKDLQSIGEGTYKPAAGSGYVAEADFCWDCHLGDDASAPANYTTYGFASGTGKIGYYHENTSSGPARWSGTLSWVSTFTFKNANIMSDHFATVTENAVRTTIAGGWTGATMSCGACHDPHGVSSLQTNAQYMVPALKGTWVTSPYKEDRPPRIDNPGASTTMFNQNDAGYPTWKDKYAGYPAPRANPEFKTTTWANSLNYNVPTASGGGMGLTKFQWTSSGGGSYNSASTRLGWDGYFIDENTFGTNGSYWGTAAVTVNRMTTANSAINSPTIFAGLCLVCHPQANIQGLTSTTQGGVTDYPHNTVMGWATTNTNIFNRGLRAMNLWYATPPTMHGMDHYSFNGTWSNYGNAGPIGTVWWGSGTIYGTKPDSTVSSNTANAHMYAWGPNPATQGSGGTDGTETAYHQFPCSKCHSPHVARLPRLMKTNCLDNDGTNTLKWSSTSTTPYVNNAGVTLYGNVYRNVACHSTYIGKPGTSANYPPANKGGWNAVTPW